MIRDVGYPGMEAPRNWRDRGIELKDQSRIPLEMNRQIWNKIYKHFGELLRLSEAQSKKESLENNVWHAVEFREVKIQPLAPGVEDYIVHYRIRGKENVGVLSVEIRNDKVGDVITRLEEA